MPTAQTTCLVIGTIHAAHLSDATYPLESFESIIDQFAPDLICIEIRPEAFNSGHLEDGPIEMSLITLLAQNKQIRTVPIDWWSENLAGIELQRKEDLADKAIEEAFRSVQAELGTSSAFEVWHSEQMKREHLRILNLAQRIRSGDSD